MKQKARPWLAFGMLVLCIAIFAFSPAFSKDSKKKPTTKESIAKLKNDIQSQRKLYKQAKATESDLLAKLSNIEKRVVEIQENLENINGQQAELKPLVEEARRILVAVQKDLELRQRVLASRIRETYKRGRYQQISVLVGARDVQDLSRRIRFLLAMAEEDKRQARVVATRRQEAADRKTELDEQQLSLDELAQMASQELIDLSSSKKARLHALAKIRDDKDAYRRRIAKLEADQAHLEKLATGKARRSSHGTVKRRTGKAPKPASVRSPTKGDVIRRFGRVEGLYGTHTRNLGIDIAASSGAAIKSVLAGRVLFSDWYGTYGLTMIVDHGDGFVTVYSHCSKLLATKDSAVAEGEIIALVGDTGTLGETILHFETRLDGRAIDPLKWLKGR